MAFSIDKISDSKRLVRGEHYLLTRRILRARDATHHLSWRILTTAGREPSADVESIRAVMPRADITVVDIDKVALVKASTLGVNVLDADLNDEECLDDIEPFDAINLDLCQVPGRALREMIRRMSKGRNLTPQGVLMTTFSYGHDVVEVGIDAVERRSGSARFLDDQGIPKHLTGRILQLLNDQQLYQRLRSVVTYRGSGGVSPMCSLLLGGRTQCALQSGRVETYSDRFGPRDTPVSVLDVGPGDYELAVVYPESMSLYDCPADRIHGLRREFAAIKASITRRKQQKVAPVAPVTVLPVAIKTVSPVLVVQPTLFGVKGL